MRIQKIINNNAVTLLEENGKEMVATGNGIGFHKKPGMAVDDIKIEKIYRMENEESLARFKELLSNLPLEHIQVSNDIIAMAKKSLGISLNQNIYITLTDHINFAIDRFREGSYFQNALTNEIQYFYSSEYSIGIYALELIEKKTGIRLPEDEASSIAIHIVNAELDLKVSDSFKLTNALGQLFSRLEEKEWLPSEESHEKKLFFTNLKFLVHRMMFNTRTYVEDEKLSDFITLNYQKEYEIVQEIKNYLYEAYGCEMQPDEEIYLALDIKRVKENTKRRE